MDETNRQKSGQRLVILALIIITALLGVLSISIGSVNIGFLKVIKIFFGINADNSVFTSIVMNIRLPRLLGALIGGASLSVSGLLLQIFFRNPIVEPYVLGISSGSSLFVGLVILGGYMFGLSSISPILLFTGAFAGAMLIMAAVCLAGKKVKNISTLLIIGIMAGFICSAGTSILIAFADNEQIAHYVTWTLGSFSGFSWIQVKFLYILAIPILILTFFMSKPLNTMLFGENYAISMGLNIKRFRMVIIVISSVLTAGITAFAGPISFVGLAVPHIVRIIFRSSDNRILIPAVIISGALMTTVCDLSARMLISPVELPLSAITSLIGAPIVVYLLLTKRSEL
jgi:iron complex transport system permease protein